MKAVLQLLWTYVAATRLGLQVSAASGVLIVVTAVTRALYPEFGVMFQTGYMPDATPLTKFLVAFVPVLAAFGLFFGTFMLPIVLGQLSMTRRLHALPHGRRKVIASGLLCIAIVSAVFTAIFALYIPPMFREDLNTFAGALGSFTILYVFLWFVTQSRTVFGKLAACMLMLAAFAIPAEIGVRTGTVERFVFVAVAWTAMAIWIGRFKQSRGVLPALGAHGRSDLATESRRIDALVGTANPWLLGVGMLVPFVVAVLFVRTPSGWLFYLTIFAALTGVIASLAAKRSRALWLRSRWTRDEIFARLEGAFWRQNRYALIVLALAHVAICVYFGLPARTLALGLALLGLATATTTYLGFMMTRRIAWLEVPLGVATMLLVMSVAVSIPDTSVSAGWVVAGLVALVGAAFGFRSLARRRWHGLDWALTNALPDSG